MVFHIARRQRPVPVTWFYGALAEQNASFVDRQAAGNNFRVAVMDDAAVGADVTGTVIALWYFKLNW